MIKALISVIAVAVLFAGLSFAQQDQKQFSPRKVQVDSDYDGKVDRIETYDASGEIQKVESDSNGNGKIDEWVIYENGRPLRKEKDSNEDGKADMWIDY